MVNKLEVLLTSVTQIANGKRLFDAGSSVGREDGRSKREGVYAYLWLVPFVYLRN